MGIKLKIVFDNVQLDETLTPAWGFAAVVDMGMRKILFDTGQDTHILVSNMRAMDIEPGEIDCVVISHSHYDHAGGLTGFVREAGGVDLYLPPGSFPDVSTDHLRALGGRTLHADAGEEIRPGVFAVHTEAKGRREQAMAVKTDAGALVVTGCAHPGVENIVADAARLPGIENIHVTGGFHLLGEDEDAFRALADELKELGVRRVSPTHCTGAPAKQVLACVQDKLFMFSRR